jgi:predicted acylesterase/phospholipase RssA
VGFLKVLEEVGIPIDIIIGNSMGALVGGLYASGYSPGDIERAAGGINWNRVFIGGPAYGLPDPTRSSDEILRVSLGGQGITGFSGLVPDQNILFLLCRLTFGVSMIEDFSRLPTPFKAVAADIAGGGLYTLERGRLYQAMRASMSIPGVFAPLALDGRYLVDGGILDNNPIRTALDWGADIVIDVNVEAFAQKNPEEIDTLPLVLSQTMRLIFAQAGENREGAGYRLDMELDEFSRLVFSDYQSLIDTGEEKTREGLEALLALAGEIEKRRPLNPRDPLRRGSYKDQPLPRFNGVRLVTTDFAGTLGESPFSQGYLNNAFRRLFDRPVDLGELESLIEKLRQEGRYQSLGYHLESLPGQPEQFGLVLTGALSTPNRYDLSLGATLAVKAGGELWADMTSWVGLRFSPFLIPQSLLRINLSYVLNQGPRADIAYRLPWVLFFNCEPFLQMSYFSETLRPHSRGGGLSTLARLDTGVNFLTTPLRSWEVYAGYRYHLSRYQENHYDTRTGARDSLPPVFGDLHLLQGGMQWQVNSEYSGPLAFQGNVKLEFPLGGSLAEAREEFPWFESLEFSARQFFSWGKQGLAWDTEAGFYRGRLENLWTLYNPRGRNGIPGYGDSSVRGRQKVWTGVSYRREIPPLTRFLGFASYANFLFRGGFIGEDLIREAESGTLKNREMLGGLAGLLILTPWGPLTLGLEVNGEGRLNFCLYFN